MDPRRPRRWAWRATLLCGHVAALLALAVLTAFPERHVFLEGGSMGGWHFRSVRPANHLPRGAAHAWVDARTGRDRSCRSVAVLLGWRDR